MDPPPLLAALYLEAGLAGFAAPVCQLLRDRAPPTGRWRNAGLDEAQAGIKIAGGNINNLRYADDTTLIGRKLGRTKEPLDESERRE